MKEAGMERPEFDLGASGSVIRIQLLFLLCYLPFINKAFHIDDPAFIRLSQMFDWNPLVAFPVDYAYMGRVLPDLLPYEATHPLLIPYVIKVITSLFGQSEIPLHLAFAIFPVIAIWSLIKLNRELFPGSRSNVVCLGILFFTMPAFIVNAQNVMTDVPSLAFLLLAMAGFVCGIEGGSRGMTWLGSLGLGLAVFTAYQSLAFVPLIFFYILGRRKFDVHSLLALGVPVLALISWLIAVYVDYEIFPLLKDRLAGTTGSIAAEVKRGLDAKALVGKAVFILGFVGSAMLWVVPTHYALRHAMAKFFRAFTFLFAGSFVATIALSEYSIAADLILALFIALGAQALGILASLVRDRIRDRQDAPQTVFLLIWFSLVVGYNIVMLPFGAARYLLPARPPLLLIILNDPAWRVPAQNRRGVVLGVLFGSALFGLGAAVSDYEHASAYREFAGEVVSVRSEVGGDSTFWYVGEWGMRHYMDRAGARSLPAASNEPRTGDMVVIPEMPRLWEPSPMLQGRLGLVAERKFSPVSPLKLFNQRSHAGFYSHLWGMLPLTFSTEPIEVFKIYRVDR